MDAPIFLWVVAEPSGMCASTVDLSVGSHLQGASLGLIRTAQLMLFLDTLLCLRTWAQLNGAALVKDTARLLRYPEARSGVRKGSLEPDATTVRREPNVPVQHVCSFLARIGPSTLERERCSQMSVELLTLQGHSPQGTAAHGHGPEQLRCKTQRNQQTRVSVGATSCRLYQ
jgi:hypothetical protein